METRLPFGRPLKDSSWGQSTSCWGAWSPFKGRLQDVDNSTRPAAITLADLEDLAKRAALDASSKEPCLALS